MQAPGNDSTAARIGIAMNVLAGVLLLVTIIWGVAIYRELPDPLPVHWNAAGQADDFRPKSIGWAFGPLFIALGVMIVMLVLDRHFGRRVGAVPSEREAYSLTFGYVNLSMAVIFSSVSFMSWYGLEPGPWFLALSLLAVLPVLLIMGVYVHRITEERKALPGHDDPSQDPTHWVLGGLFYRNASDPRTLVPKPPHTGVGMTLNLATLGGKLILASLLLVVVGAVVLAVLL